MSDELRRNTILAALPDSELARLSELVTVVDVEMRDVVVEAGKPIGEVHFPLTSIYSMVALADDDQASVEVATVGFEGMVGLPLFLGVLTSPNVVFTQVAGRSAVMSAGDLGAFLARDGVLHGLLHRYTQVMLVQVSQSVVCNNAHPVEQRAARWLLMTADRVLDETFPMTQEFLVQMLGVCSESVTVAMNRLQADGLIRYGEGTVHVLDREGLERTACGCYRIVKSEFDTMTG